MIPLLTLLVPLLSPLTNLFNPDDSRWSFTKYFIRHDRKKIFFGSGIVLHTGQRSYCSIAAVCVLLENAPRKPAIDFILFLSYRIQNSMNSNVPSRKSHPVHRILNRSFHDQLLNLVILLSANIYHKLVPRGRSWTKSRRRIDCISNYTFFLLASSDWITPR